MTEVMWCGSLAVLMLEALKGVAGLCTGAMRESTHAVCAGVAWWESRMCCAEEW